MNAWRNATATVLVVSLLHLSLSGSLEARTPKIPAPIKEQVDQFGVGAKVGVKLAGGEKLRGSIDAIEGQGFLLSSQRENGPRRIPYDEVAELKLAKRVYRASDQPDVVEAKRVVVALGVGKHAVVKVTGGKKLHGHIQAIEGDHFTLQPDNQPSPVQIAYSDVWYVEKNLSAGATIVLVILIGAAVLVAATVMATR